jgi:predicted Zn-dependent protease
VCLLLLAASLACLAEPVGERPTGEIDLAFVRLYNTDFRGAHAHLDRYVSAQPADPLGYAMRASAYSFSEMDRLGILESEFFGDDKRIIAKKQLRPDPAVREKFFRAIEDARARATKILAANPVDQNALFSMAVTQGVLMDYTALVDKRQLSSLTSARNASNYAQQLLKINPQFIDAYLTTGLTEYLLGSLPFYLRWFVHFDGVNGSKTQGIDNLQLVARSGHYLRPFAKILLAIVYMREKQPRETQKLLLDLTAEYPENALLRKELIKVSEEVGRGGTNGK